MIFASSFDLLDDVIYKGKAVGVVMDIQFSVNEDYDVEESYGILFEDDSYLLDVNPDDLKDAKGLMNLNLS